MDGWGLPQNVLTQPRVVNRAIPSSGSLPTSDPTAKANAHGIVPLSGCVAVEVSAACTLTIFTYSPMSKTWLNPGSASSSYQKTFSAAGWDYFVCPPGYLFYIKSGTSSITAYTDGDPVS